MSNEGWRRGGGGEANDDGLGSLAQSARKTSLKQARVILFVVGGLTILANTFLFFNVENEARNAIKAEAANLGPGMVIDPVKAREVEETIVRIGRLIYGGTVFLGVVFVVLGFAVHKAPVACTVTGLVLYIAAIAVFAVLEPLTIVQGIIIKIFIILAMVKAVQAAVAYEREAKAEKLARDDGASF